MSRAILFQQLERIVVSEIFKLMIIVNLSSKLYKHLGKSKTTKTMEPMCSGMLIPKTDLYKDLLPIVLLNGTHELVQKLSIFLNCKNGYRERHRNFTTCINMRSDVA